MVALTPGVPFEIGQPVLDIDGGLEPGAWTVELVVIDNDANESAPQRLRLKIADRAPVPEPGPVRPGGPRFPGGVFDPRRPIPIDPDVELRPRRPIPIDPDVVVRPRRPIPLDPDVVVRPRRPLDPRILIRRPPQ